MKEEQKEFFLSMEDETMRPTFEKGDTLIVIEGSTIKDREPHFLLIGNEIMCRVVTMCEDGITVGGYDNDICPVKHYTEEEIQKLPIKIIGRVKELRRHLSMNTRSEEREV